MPTTHIIAQGECLSSLAYQYRLASGQEIYDDPNNADLRAKRSNPNVLCPGDQVYIPDPKQRADDVPTDKKHIFVANLPPVYLNVRIEDIAEEPIKNAQYELKLEVVTLTGSTDGDGWIRSPIPASAELGTLKVWPNPDAQDVVIEWDLKLGFLDPVETVSGVKGRLNNLGYNCGDITSNEDDLYHDTLSQYQQDKGVTADDTNSTLEKEHLV